jgi:NEDD4-binding protein 2
MSKVLILMRGVSGSGKSTYAKRIQEERGGVIYSTDDFFMKDGEYQFDGSQIGRNHERNQQRTAEAMRMGINLIIIDNTNTQRWEMKPYVQMADEHNYTIEIVELSDIDFDTIMERQGQRADQNKALSAEIVKRMLNRFEIGVSVSDIRES